MRLLVPATVLAAALAACAPQPTASGNRDSGAAYYERSARTLWIRGDQPYYVPPDVAASSLNDAASVTLWWQQEGDRRVVTDYRIDRRRSDERRR